MSSVVRGAQAHNVRHNRTQQTQMISEALNAVCLCTRRQPIRIRIVDADQRHILRLSQPRYGDRGDVSRPMITAVVPKNTPVVA